MSNTQDIYTYRAGQKVKLVKLPNQFVVRVLPAQLAAIGITTAEQVSSASSRVTCLEADLERLMSQARHLAPTHHAYQLAETGEDFLITDRLFITFHNPLSAEQVGEFAGRYGLLQRQAFSDRDYLLQLTEHAEMNPVKLVVKLMEEEPLVELAEHDLNYSIDTYSLPLPTDPSYQKQWHLHTHFSHPDFDPRSSSRCEAAWELLGSFGSIDVVVGVTDDGCKLDHPDFDSPTKFAGWGYFVGERLVKLGDVDAIPSQMYQADANHGTACAGVIAAEVDAALTVGVAPSCQLLPIKWQSTPEGGLFISDSKLLAAFNYLADKVDVVSNSWGSTPRSVWSAIVTRRVEELAKTGGRRGKGIVFLWAAGNENCPMQHTASVEVPYDNGWEFRNNSWVWVGVSKTRFFQNNLVGIPGVMHIAALASTAQRSHYSNYGSGIAVCAPSNNVHEYARLPVRGLGITTTTGKSGLIDPAFGGTSSATPLVAGIIALVISANPDLTALEVISLLKRTASKDLNFQGYGKTPPANYDRTPTWDISPIAPFDQGSFTDIQHPDGTWSPWFGHGRVDAAAAVASALQQKQPPASSHLSYASKPAKTLPDNDPTGIQDLITVAESGQLSDIRVTLSLTHTWIGDLHIQLTAPNGTSIVLHDRSGSSQHDLQQTYDIQAIPTLASLRNSPVQGDWLLQVQDLAAQDVGVLQSWGLELEVGTAPTTAEDSEAVPIPDLDPTGVVRSLNLPSGTVIKDLAVSVDITHPQIGDLRVTLIPPSGIPATLHDQAGGSTDNLVQTWRSPETISLRSLQGKESGGIWQLRVADLSGNNIGKLNRWKIEVTG